MEEIGKNNVAETLQSETSIENSNIEETHIVMLSSVTRKFL